MSMVNIWVCPKICERPCKSVTQVTTETVQLMKQCLASGRYAGALFFRAVPFEAFLKRAKAANEHVFGHKSLPVVGLMITNVKLC